MKKIGVKEKRAIPIIIIIALATISALAVCSTSDVKDDKPDKGKEEIKKEYEGKIEKFADGRGTVKGNNDLKSLGNTSQNAESKQGNDSYGVNFSAKPGSSTSGANPSAGNLEGTKPTEQGKPSHVHNWQPVYETVTKYRIEYEDKYYYNGKYYDTYEEGYDAYLNDGHNGISGGSLSPVTIEVRIPYNEQIITGYRCSCGAVS